MHNVTTETGQLAVDPESGKPLMEPTLLLGVKIKIDHRLAAIPKARRRPPRRASKGAAKSKAGARSRAG